MVMLRRWSVYWRENGHVPEVDNLKGGKSSLLRRWPA